MRKYLSVVLGVLFFVPSVSFAASLTQPQVSAIISLLEAFGVSPAVIAEVQADLAPAPQVSVTPSFSSTVAPQQSFSRGPVVNSVATSTVGPAPQFVGKPVVAYGPNKNSAIVTWQTDIPATAALCIGQSRPGDWTQGEPLQTFPQATSFTATTDPRMGVWFYGLVITANGESTQYTGQLPSF